MPYTQLNKEERIQIEALWKAGHSRKDIGRRLHRATTTITKELERNGDASSGWYKALQANRFCLDRRVQTNQELHAKLFVGSSFEQYVEAKLRLHWSPEQIAGRFNKEQKKAGKGGCLSHETIYLFLYKKRKDLIPFLRHSKKRRYRRRNGTKQREMRREEAKKRRIDTRPKEVETRKELGHWEGDTIVGKEKTERILTHVERKSRFTCADKIKRATAAAIHAASVNRLKRFPKRKRKTSTYDNGIEFSEHAKTERDAEIKIYFAYPYHSWERGTNENTNGLLREFFPKGSTFKDVSQRDVDRAVKFLNTRPRKCLHYLTPDEVFFERGLTLN